MTNQSADDASTLPLLICIDDDSGVLASIERLLRKDFRVLQAQTSEDGEALIENNPGVAIVLADLRLPGRKQGLDLLRFAQSRSPDASRSAHDQHRRRDERPDHAFGRARTDQQSRSGPLSSQKAGT